MKRVSTYLRLSFVYILLLLVCTSNYVSGQSSTRTSLGISFPNTLNELQIINSIPELKDLGFEIIELQHPVSDDLIKEISKFSLELWIRTDLKFSTLSQINHPDHVMNALVSHIETYSSLPMVSRIGLTSYSARLDAQKIHELSSYNSNTSNTSFYEVNTISNPNLLTVINADAYSRNPSNAYFIFESPFLSKDVPILTSINNGGAQGIFFDYFWLEEAMENISYLKESLKAYADSDDTKLLLPDLETRNSKNIPNWPTIVLLLLWMSIGLHMKSNPTYRPLIVRYFTYHRFFVDDIMRYRERSTTPGIILFIQHAYFTGLIIYILSATFVSDKGLEAFFFHFPVVAVFGVNYFTLFAIAVITTFILSFVGLLWLYIPSKSMKHFSQVLSLYSWIFHIDFILVSCGLILLITEASNTSILLLVLGHFLVWILGFFFAAYDSSQYLTHGKIKYLSATVGLFLLLLGSILIGFLNSGSMYDILNLAFTL